ncbi:MAG: carbohydrate kinase family protein [Christensenellales bacterium]|jgi:sugar/nucleoside kinase (ribokinase family)
MEILAVGSCVFDAPIAPVPYDVTKRRFSPVKTATAATGGDALNGSISLAALGHHVGLFSVVGGGPAGDAIVRRLKQTGVDMRYIRRLEDKSAGFSAILVPPDGERTIIHAPGGNWELDIRDISNDILKTVRHVHVASFSNTPKTMSGEPLGDLLKRAHENGCTTSMDTVTYYGDAMAALAPCLPHLDIFLPSHYEISVMAGGIDDPLELKEFIRPYGVKIFGLKMGGDGIFVTDYKQDIFMKPMYRGTPVDTTGAGDSCFAGFVSGFLHGFTLEQCAQLAMAQAAQIVGAMGANLGVKPRAEVLKYAESFGVYLPK